MKNNAPPRVAIVGGGWAGCAAAVELTQCNCRVTLFEAARTLGGRARKVEIESMSLDNGQHILLGAYTETLRLLKLTGITRKEAILTVPLQMRYPTGGLDFVAPCLPAPLHVLFALLRATGITRQDKMAFARFSTTAKWMGWRLDTDCSVSELLWRFDQSDRLTRLMWRPLCIAALNTPPERASAQIFLNVLRDSFGGRRAASDMLIPRIDLTALFPDKAKGFLHARGGEVLLGATVTTIELDSDSAGWLIKTAGEANCFDAVIVATPPAQAAQLLDGLIDTRLLNALTYEPITTCYLQYSSDVRLASPFLALIDDADANAWGQFVFDRGQLKDCHAGLLAVVVSASSAAIEIGHEALGIAIAHQLADVLSWPELKTPMWTRVISEKRATFSCTPGLARPRNETALDGLLLAGDYTAVEYLATLEGATRSGTAAARSLMRQWQGRSNPALALD